MDSPHPKFLLLKDIEKTRLAIQDRKIWFSVNTFTLRLGGLNAGRVFRVCIAYDDCTVLVWFCFVLGVTPLVLRVYFYGSEYSWKCSGIILSVLGIKPSLTICKAIILAGVISLHPQQFKITVRRCQWDHSRGRPDLGPGSICWVFFYLVWPNNQKIKMNQFNYVRNWKFGRALGAGDI